MTTLGIVASIDRSSSSVRVATLASTASHPAFDVPGIYLPRVQHRDSQSHRCDLRSEYLFKAVLKAQAGTPRCGAASFPTAEESRGLILQRRRRTRARSALRYSPGAFA